MAGLAYVDTSVLAAILFREPGAEEIHERLRDFDTLFSSNLLEAELRAAGAREDIPTAKITASLESMEWVFPNRSLQQELERTLAVGYVRGADLWHLSCALYVSHALAPVTFVTLDRRQRDVAEAVGLTVM